MQQIYLAFHILPFLIYILLLSLLSLLSWQSLGTKVPISVVRSPFLYRTIIPCRLVFYGQPYSGLSVRACPSIPPLHTTSSDISKRNNLREFSLRFPISDNDSDFANYHTINTTIMATMANNDRETQQPTCQNCQTSTTPLWRRDEIGSVLCNACGLFLKLHGRPRPISLKTDVIKSRNRVKSSGTAQGAKKKVFVLL